MKHIKELVDCLIDNNQLLVTAESCTGGLIAKLCTDIAGSSRWFERGFITYSNQSKVDMLNVDKTIIDTKGAVSQEVAEAMAQGAISNSKANCSIAVTGIAGPEGGTQEKPVGTVWISWCAKQITQSQCYRFIGGREAIREQAAEQAILNLKRALQESQ